MTRVEIEVEAIVNPTESVEKVERVVRNVLGDVCLERMTQRDRIMLSGRLEGIESLSHLRGLLRRMRIRDAARAFLSRNVHGDIITFGLNKQAAFSGRVSFYHAMEASLGPIQVTIRGDADGAIRYICD